MGRHEGTQLRTPLLPAPEHAGLNKIQLQRTGKAEPVPEPCWSWAGSWAGGLHAQNAAESWQGRLHRSRRCGERVKKWDERHAAISCGG